jgi:D-alanine-D-alanine ligase
MPPVRRVAVLVDREMRVEGDPNLVSDEALRHAGMEFHVAAALRRLGYQVAVIPCLSGHQLVAELTCHAPDVVYNATEHFDGRRGDDIQITALLELLRIPYTGATSTALLLGRDKAVSKSLANMVGVRAPAFALAPPGELSPPHLPPFPVVVKPVDGDSSEGINMSSVVRNRDALAARLRSFHRRYRQTAIVEQFIPGADVYAFVLQERTLRILPPVRLCIDADAHSPRSMATYHCKHSEAYRTKWNIHARPAEMSAKTKQELERGIRRLWPVLQLRDYGRFDFRMTPDGDLYFLEANPNPGFSPLGRYDVWGEQEYTAAMKMLVMNAARRGG